MTELTLVTRDATLDDMSRQDYVDAYQELRRWDENKQEFAVSYGQWVKLAGEPPSKAHWNRLDKGETDYTRSIRNAIRRVLGRPELPPTVIEAVSRHTLEDAAVWRLGEGAAGDVILVGDVPTGVSLYVNGEIVVSEPTDVPSVESTPRTLARRAMYRPVLPVELKERVEKSGRTVEELVEYALQLQKQEAWW